MVFPKNNLGTTVQPWAREVEKRVVNIESAAIKNEVNNVARDAQLALSYRRLDTAVKDIKTITDDVFSLNTDVTNLNTDVGTIETNVFVTGTTQINGYNIKAGTINANAINAGTLTGFTIQTASTGTRIVMGGSTIDVWYGSTKVGVLSGTNYLGSAEVSLLAPDSSNGLYILGDSVWMDSVNSYVQAANGVARMSGGGSQIYANSSGVTSTGAFNAPGVTSTSGYLYGTSGSLRMQNDGTDYAQISSVYNRTYTATANMYVNSNSTIGRATSASKYKLAIEEKTGYDFSKILQLKPKSWFDKGTSELYAQYLSDLYQGKTPKEMADNEPLERINGLIAEDLVAVGLDDYVTWGPYKEDGTREPEGIQYDRLWTCLIPLVKELTDRITALENN